MSLDNLRELADLARRAQADIDALGAGPVRHNCAHVERDNLDLHQALTEALHRIQELRSELGRYVYLEDRYGVADLIEVLDRTSRPAVK